MAGKKGKDSKAPRELVGVGAKLRNLHKWFETLSEGMKAAAISKRRKAERNKGAALESGMLIELVDELERIQQQLNPLENRRKEILAQLLPHWGHTGVEEIEGTLGKTLIATSFEMCVDQDIVQSAVSEEVWHSLTRRALIPEKLLAQSKDDRRVRDAVAEAMSVKKVKVMVIPPSSRRPKSGSGAEEDEE